MNQIKQSEQLIKQKRSHYEVGDTVHVGVRSLKAKVTSVNFEVIMVVELLDKLYHSVRVVVDKSDLSIVTPLRYWESSSTLQGFPRHHVISWLSSNKAEEDIEELTGLKAINSNIEQESKQFKSALEPKLIGNNKTPLYNAKFDKYLSTKGEQ